MKSIRSKCSFLSLLFVVATEVCFGWTSADVFAKYPNPYFVETGTYLGEGIQRALDAGFPQVYSIELSPKYHQKAQRKFRKKPNVHLVFGDSGVMLKQVIASIHAPITFWLDGHWSAGDTAKAGSITPLLDELESIRQHPIKTHTIMIDDVRCFGAPFDGVTFEQTVAKLREINPNYTICYEDGLVPNDVLVAYIKK